MRRWSCEAIMELLEVPAILSLPDWVVATITVLSVTEIHVVAHPPLLLLARPHTRRPGETDQVGVHHSVVPEPLVGLVCRLLQSGHGHVLHLLLLNLESKNVSAGGERGQARPHSPLTASQAAAELE